MKMPDWEEFLEGKLIPLVESAGSRAALGQCARLVIEKLLADPRHAVAKSAFLEQLESQLEETENVELDDAHRLALDKRHVSRLLRELNLATTEGPDGKEETEQPAAAAADAGGPELASRIFADICWGMMRQRFEVLQNGIPQERSENDKLPYLLSRSFTNRLERLVREFVVPGMLEKSQAFVVRASRLPAGQFESYYQNCFEDPRNLAALQDMWLAAWEGVTVQKKVPPKPEEKGLKDKLKMGQKADRAMTIEQWQAASKRIKAANLKTAQFLKEILADDETYLPPPADDLTLLCDLFLKSADGVRKQIAAIRQIAEQGGNVGMVYDMYQKNKDIDLAMLAVCHQYPALFFDMEKRYLKVMLAGTQERERKERLPLTLRYLSSLL